MNLLKILFLYRDDSNGGHFRLILEQGSHAFIQLNHLSKFLLDFIMLLSIPCLACQQRYVLGAFDILVFSTLLVTRVKLRENTSVLTLLHSLERVFPEGLGIFTFLKQMNKGFCCFFAEITGIHLFYTYLARRSCLHFWT